MIYRLKELKGDTIAVPQLVFSKLGIAEEYNVRVALYVLATGVTDPDKICADLKLRSRISAESALAFWAGAGPVSYTHLDVYKRQVNKLLEPLYDLIMYKGFDENWDYNSFGEDAQNVYDDLYNNN